MADTTHTPGPWTYRLHYPVLGRPMWIVYRGANPNTTVIGDTARDEADARLIAAAPELLAACREVERLLLDYGDPFSGDDHEALARIRAAIASATGQPAD